MDVLAGRDGFINWEAESYPEAKDLLLIPLFALLFPTLRLYLDTYVFEKIARRLMFGEGFATVHVETYSRRKKINKFKESAWKCVYFLSAELFALTVSYNEPWFRNTKYFWVGSGDQTWPDLKMKLKLKALYAYGAGFYTYSIFALIFWETKRSDFAVSMTHHMASITLIGLSYIFRFGRVGAMVLVLHDGCDFFLETGKMSKYSGYEGIASISFLLFVLTFTMLRIICFPLLVLRSTSYQVLMYLDKGKHALQGAVCYYVFNTLLYCLLVVNIYWWILMIKMLIAQIKAKGQVSDDVRSDSEGEDETEHND
ncbi:hypothetical protein K2173_003895 [Erythroxylum novogranatense]|uniref:TLC domain-containing protein n=1 Tax=Erythroxylum novogranatense TaxID=1862640 RepID=A0AAV8SJL2_9ROSI|nr:hypothetical protein K2173_003895 [Erythroxylum novogranatense]